MALYLDTSALAKLVLAENESPALRRHLRSSVEPLVTSDLARTELLRAVRRGVPRRVAQARRLLDSLTVQTMPTALCEHAGQLEPAVLRSLDALHLAAALSLGDDLSAIVTYDERLTDAAEALGVVVQAPR